MQNFEDIKPGARLSGLDPALGWVLPPTHSVEVEFHGHEVSMCFEKFFERDFLRERTVFIDLSKIFNHASTK